MSVDAKCSGELEKLQRPQIVKNVVRNVLDWVPAEVDRSHERISTEKVAIDRLDLIVRQIELGQLRENVEIRLFHRLNVPAIVSDCFEVWEKRFNFRRHEVVVAIDYDQGTHCRVVVSWLVSTNRLDESDVPAILGAHEASFACVDIVECPKTVETVIAHQSESVRRVADENCCQ